MIHKFLGIIDFLTGLFTILIRLGIMSRSMLVGFAVYLIVKGIIFRMDFLSMLDFAAGLAILAILITNSWTVTVIVGAYLIIKGFLSII